MSAERYNEALKRVLVHEGGYVNDPRDPGGATMKGVTQRTYDGYRKRLGLPSRPVSQITSAEVGEIYRRQYWAAVRGDELPAGIDYVLFDGAVNSGPVQSIKWLQRALGVSVDGVLGEATVAEGVLPTSLYRLTGDLAGDALAIEPPARPPRT